MWAVPYREFKTFPKEGCSQRSVGVELKGGSAPLVKIIVECYCFFLLIIIDEGAGDAAFRFVLLKPALSEVMFKLLL